MMIIEAFAKRSMKLAQITRTSRILSVKLLQCRREPCISGGKLKCCSMLLKPLLQVTKISSHRQIGSPNNGDCHEKTRRMQSETHTRMQILRVIGTAVSPTSARSQQSAAALRLHLRVSMQRAWRLSKKTGAAFGFYRFRNAAPKSNQCE